MRQTGMSERERSGSGLGNNGGTGIGSSGSGVRFGGSEQQQYSLMNSPKGQSGTLGLEDRVLAANSPNLNVPNDMENTLVN